MCFKVVKKEAEGMYGRLKGFEETANELLQEDEIISGIKMSTFDITPQRMGFAKKQILKVVCKLYKLRVKYISYLLSCFHSLLFSLLVKEF